MITLGIIGIVAAMTIPTLMHSYYEKQTVAKLKETQSIISQAMRMAEEEYGDADGWFVSGTTTADKAVIIWDKLKYFLKIATDCGMVDTDEKCVVNENYKGLSGSNGLNYASHESYKVQLLNGSTIIWNWNGDGIHFYIDTNGKAKPNTWGRDLFMFSYVGNSLKPSGSPGSLHDYRTTCVKSNKGTGCAWYILQYQNMNYLR